MGLRGRTLFGSQGHTFFITTSVVGHAKVFAAGDQYYDILVASLTYVLNEHAAALIAYVLMPNHVHLITALPEGESISDLMRDFKKYTSTRIRQQLERDGQDSFLRILRHNTQGRTKQVFKLWKDRFDDLVIESETTLRVKVEYMHNNPVRAGLVSNPEDWRYSSARNYLRDDHSVLPVTTDWDVGTQA